MRLPPVVSDVGDDPWPRSAGILWRGTADISMNSLPILVIAKSKELVLQVAIVPEQRAIEELSANPADQSFHERVRPRRAWCVLTDSNSRILGFACQR